MESAWHHDVNLKPFVSREHSLLKHSNSCKTILIVNLVERLGSWVGLVVRQTSCRFYPGFMGSINTDGMKNSAHCLIIHVVHVLGVSRNI